MVLVGCTGTANKSVISENMSCKDTGEIYNDQSQRIFIKEAETKQLIEYGDLSSEQS